MDAWHRLEARLLAVPHDVLARCAARAVDQDAAANGSLEVRGAIHFLERVLAQAKPLPCWAVSGVLLSTEDLLPCLFAQLDPSNHAAAAVCSTWHRAWHDMLRAQHHLRPERQTPTIKAAFDLSMRTAGENLRHQCLCASAGGSEFAIAERDTITVSVSGSARRVQFEKEARCLAMTDTDMWVGVDKGHHGFARLCRLRMPDFSILAQISTDEMIDADGDHLEIWDAHGDDLTPGAARDILAFTFGVLSSDESTLFVMDTFGGDDYDILIFEAATLTYRTTLVGYARDYGRGMQVDRGVLYILSESGDDLACYSVESLQPLPAVELPHRAWDSDMTLRAFCAHGGRLYMLCADDDAGDDDESQEVYIFVLTPAGQLMQQFNLMRSRTYLRRYDLVEWAMCAADGRLVVQASGHGIRKQDHFLCTFTLGT